MEKKLLDPPPELGVKQSCQPSAVLLPSVVQEKVVPALREVGTVSEDSTSTPSIIK